jgi:hypothetical protein
VGKRGVLENGDRGAVGNEGQRRSGFHSILFRSDSVGEGGRFEKGSDVRTQRSRRRSGARMPVLLLSTKH